MKGYWRLALFVVLFAGLATAGIAWGVRSSGVTLADLGDLWRLPVGTLVLLFALCFTIYVADVVRYRIFGRAIGETISWRAACDASVANYFFSWITPGAALGAPAAIVMLGRRGVSWDGAVVIAFGKSLTSTAVLIVLAFGMLAIGLGPELDGSMLAVFTTGTGLFAAMLLVPIVGAIWPAATTRGLDRLEGWLGRRRVFAGERARRVVAKLGAGLRDAVRRLARLRSGGAAMPLAILASHLVTLGLLIAVAVVLAHAFGASSTPRAIGISTVYVGFSYVAPTPGGAGLSEAAGPAFYGAILSTRDAMVVVLLFRALTFYLEIAVGIVYLAIVGGTAQILARSRLTTAETSASEAP